MKAPIVSVIVPTFNRAHLIFDTLNSVLAQTYRPIELIVVDDGSTDNTRENCTLFAAMAKNRHVDFIYHYQTNAGVSTARNTGIHLAKGEFIQYLDSDDLIHPRKLEIQVAFLLQHPEVGLCLSSCVHGERPETYVWNTHIVNPAMESCYDFILFGNTYHLSALYQASLINQIPPWEIDYPLGEDIIFLTRAMIHSRNIGIDNNPFVFLREHNGPRLTQCTTETWCKNKLRFHRLFWDIASTTPMSYQKKLAEFLHPHLLSCARYCIARGYLEVAKGLIAEACRLPASDTQKVAIQKVQRALGYPRLFARILFRLGRV